MSWGSLQNFAHMGGYAVYVWGAYGVTLLCICLEVLSLRKRSRQARR